MVYPWIEFLVIPDAFGIIRVRLHRVSEDEILSEGGLVSVVGLSDSVAAFVKGEVCVERCSGAIERGEEGVVGNNPGRRHDSEFFTKKHHAG